jgi:RNA polymerase sigma factor (sigma-70 family)
MTREHYGDAYQRNFEPMVRSVMQRGVPRAAAEDAVQSGWATGWERLDQLRDAALLVWWVTRIITNKLRDDFRSRQHTRQLEPEDTIAVPPTANVAAIDLQRALWKCPPRQRALLETVYLEDRSAREVAGDLGTSVSALHQRLSTARRSLRKAHGRGLADARQGGA